MPCVCPDGGGGTGTGAVAAALPPPSPLLLPPPTSPAAMEDAARNQGPPLEHVERTGAWGTASQDTANVDEGRQANCRLVSSPTAVATLIDAMRRVVRAARAGKDTERRRMPRGQWDKNVVSHALP